MFLTMLLPPPVDAGKLFDACIAAHKRLDAASVSIDSTTKAQGKSFHNLYAVRFHKPDKLLLRIRSESPKGSDRSYLLNGNLLVAVDSRAHEYLQRSSAAKGSLADRAALMLGTLDDGVRVEIDPSALAKFFEDLRKAKGWVRSGNRLQLNGAKATANLEFTPAHLLKSARITGPGSLLSWKFEYGPKPGSLTLAIPPDSQKVDSFVDGGTQRVTFKDKNAERIWSASMRAYGNLKSGVITVRSGGETATLAFSGKRAAQRQSGFAWSYDGHNLSILRDGHFFRGPVTLGDLTSKVGDRIDPFLQSWSMRKNPARNLAAQKMKVKVVGSELVQGLRCDVLQFSRTEVKVTVAVRRSDHLFARVVSEGLDPAGKRFSGLAQTFTYQHVNGAIPVGALEINPSAGQQVEKLP